MGSDDANGENGCDDYTHPDNMNDEYLTMLGLLSSPMVAGSKLSSVMIKLISKINTICRCRYVGHIAKVTFSALGCRSLVLRQLLVGLLQI